MARPAGPVGEVTGTGGDTRSAVRPKVLAPACPSSSVQVAAATSRGLRRRPIAGFMARRWITGSGPASEHNGCRISWPGSSGGANTRGRKRRAPAGVERRLAATLAADVVGSPALRERDEARPRARLKAHRKEFIEP